MAKKLSNDRRSHPILPVTTEATQYRGQNTGRQPYPVALHRELEATPESFVTNQLWLLLGKSLNPGGSIFQLLEAVIVPPLFSLIFYKIKMRWCMKVLCEIQSTRQNSKLLWCYWSIIKQIIIIVMGVINIQQRDFIYSEMLGRFLKSTLKLNFEGGEGVCKVKVDGVKIRRESFRGSLERYLGHYELCKRSDKSLTWLKVWY